jgi:ABC-type proline/glycine betaine transport system permease subunit
MEGPPAVEAVCFAQDSGIIISVLTTQTTLPPLELFHMFKVVLWIGLNPAALRIPQKSSPRP